MASGYKRLMHAPFFDSSAIKRQPTADAFQCPILPINLFIRLSDSRKFSYSEIYAFEQGVARKKRRGDCIEYDAIFSSDLLTAKYSLWVQPVPPPKYTNAFEDL